MTSVSTNRWGKITPVKKVRNPCVKCNDPVYWGEGLTTFRNDRDITIHCSRCYRSER